MSLQWQCVAPISTPFNESQEGPFKVNMLRSSRNYYCTLLAGFSSNEEVSYFLPLELKPGVWKTAFLLGQPPVHLDQEPRLAGASVFASPTRSQIPGGWTPQRKPAAEDLAVWDKVTKDGRVSTCWQAQPSGFEASEVFFLVVFGGGGFPGIYQGLGSCVH